jgi:HlyD family secretion protein
MSNKQKQIFMELIKKKRFYQKKWFWIFLILVLSGVLYFVLTREQVQKYVTEPVRRMDIKQIVTVTGKVNAEPTINMNFQAVGKVSEILFEVGDEVKKGVIIAEIENESQTIAVQNAEAELTVAEAILEQRIAGSTKEEIEVAQTVVYQAQSDLELTKIDYENIQKISEQNITRAKLQLKDAETVLETARIELDNLIITTTEDIKSAEKEVESALINLNKTEIEFKNSTKTTGKTIDDAYENLYTALNDSILAMNNNLITADNLLGIDNRDINDNIEKLLGVLDGKTINRANENYRLARDEYNLANDFYLGVDQTNVADLEKAYSLVNAAMIKVDVLMNSIALLLDKTITSAPFLTEEGLASLKTEINTLQDLLNITKESLTNRYQSLTSAFLNTDTSDEQSKAAFEVAKNNYAVAEQTLTKMRANVESSIKIAEARVGEAENKLNQAEQNVILIQTESENNISSAKSRITLKEKMVQNAKANLALVRADPREVDLKSLRARVDQAKSALESAKFELSKTQILAPVDGIVTQINIEKGSTYLGSTDRELLSAAVTVVAKQMRIEADVPETDITKINVGDPVDMTLDAFPAGTNFQGKISKIDPAETLISGVVYYRIETEFNIEYEGVKPGMTANLEILTAESEDTLAVPLRAVLFEGEKAYIRVLKGEEYEKKEVEIGLEEDLYVEVIDTVKEGDEVVIQVVE